MARLKALSPEEASGKSKELFTAIEGKLGMVPNMMRTMGTSPAALEGYLNLSGALSSGKLGAKKGELIALAVAEANSCDYCLSAHTYIGSNLVKIDNEDLSQARQGKSTDTKTEAALIFAKALVTKKGLVTSEDVTAVKTVGYTDGEVGEIVANVALNIFTNYLNNTAQTDIDFPTI